MKIGSLFSGYGGLDLAVETVFNGETVWHAEIDLAATKVLAHRWPGVPNLGDITTVDWEQVARYAPVDVLAGGFPCQDVSIAGLRAGLKPGTRSGLWAEMAAAIEILRPRFVVVENVLGLLTAEAQIGENDGPTFSSLEPGPTDVRDPDTYTVRAFEAVLGTFANLGYDAVWSTFRASQIGAPHRRERVFIVAWDSTNTDGFFVKTGSPTPPQAGKSVSGVNQRELTTAQHVRLTDTEVPVSLSTPQVAAGGPVSDLRLQMCNLLATPTAHPTGRSLDGYTARKVRAGLGPAIDDLRLQLQQTAEIAGLLPTPRAAAGGSACETRDLLVGKNGFSFGGYQVAVDQWENVLGRPAPEPLEQVQTSKQPRLTLGFVEWMMGLPEGWVTEVEGVSHTAGLRMLGNGVVPQQAVTVLGLLLSQVREVVQQHD